MAQSAIGFFGVAAPEVAFLGHNSGVAYRVESAGSGRLLLKVHAPQGDSAGLPAAAIRRGLRWLATMAETTDIPVQAPLTDPSGDLLPFVHFEGMSLPCSLQGWLDGEQVAELSADQAHAVGELMGRWQEVSEQHATVTEEAARYDGRHLAHALEALRVLTTTGAITQESWHTIEESTARAIRLIESMGTSSDVFGVVHGDVNPDNIIVAADGTVQLIDLAQLMLAPYLWDLGVAFYQF